MYSTQGIDLPPRGDGTIEQEDGYAPADGIVQGVDDHGLLAGLYDQGRDAPAGGGTDRAGQTLGRRPFLRIGLGEPEGNADLPELMPEHNFEENAVVVRRPGQDQFHDLHTPAPRLPRVREAECGGVARTVGGGRGTRLGRLLQFRRLWREERKGIAARRDHQCGHHGGARRHPRYRPEPRRGCLHGHDPGAGRSRSIGSAHSPDDLILSASADRVNGDPATGAALTEGCGDTIPGMFESAAWRVGKGVTLVNAKQASKKLVVGAHPSDTWDRPLLLGKEATGWRSDPRRDPVGFRPSGRGCNSRRLHALCYRLFFRKNYAYDGRG